MKVGWFVLVILLAVVFLGSSNAEAADRVCKQWYKKKQYEEASRCYFTLASQYMSKSNITDEQKESIGMWLRNAALSLKRAARATQSTENAAYLREKAIQYLTLYLDKKYYETNTQKTSAQVQRTSLKGKVGYTTLTITTNKATHSINVTGFRFKATMKGTWSKTVRPGNYTVLVRSVKGLSSAKVVKVRPGKPMVVSVPIKMAPIRREDPRPPPPRPPVAPAPQPAKVNVGAWVLIGLGLASTAVSVTMFALGARERALGDSLYNSTVKNGTGTLTNTREVLQYQNNSNQDFTIGWLFAGAAVATGGAGLIWFFLEPKQARKLPPSSSPPKSNSSYLLLQLQ